MKETKSMESMHHLVHLIKRKLHDHVENLELNITPMHVRVMKIIHRKSNCSAVDIASFLNRDKAQVTRLLNTLLDQSLITKAPNPEDKRSQHLLLTPAGNEIIKQMANIDTQLIEQMTQGITPEELTEFERIANKMAENLYNS